MIWIRRAVVSLAALVVAVLALGAAGIGYLASPGQHRWVARAVSSIISTPDAAIEIGDISVKLPATLDLADVVLRDRAGDWLRTDALSVTIRLLPLLGGRLDITRLAIDRADLARPPESSGGSGSTTTPLPVTIEHFTVATAQLEPAVVGERVVLGAKGNLELDAERIALALAVQRGDGQPGHLTLDVDYRKPAAQLSAKGELDEPTGILLDRLIGRREPLQATLSGAGPLADWHGTLGARAGDLAQLAATLGIAPQGGGYVLDAAGTLSAEKFIPAEYAGLVGDRLRFAVRADNATASRIALDRLDLELAAGSLTAQGILNTADDTLSGSADVKLPDLKVLAALAPGPLGGAGTAHLDLAGRLTRPAATLAVDLSEPSYAGDRVQRATAEVSLTMLDDIAAPDPRFRATGSGRLEGLALSDTALPADLSDRIDWTFDATADRAGRQIQVTSLSVGDAGVALDAAMTVTNGAAEGEANLAIPDPARLSLPLSGNARLAAAFAAQAANGTVTARLSGTVDQLVLPNDRLDPLLGHRAELTATVRRAADGHVTVTDLDASAGAVSLAGSADLVPELHSLAVQLKLAVPDLAAVGPIGGEAVSGRLSASADLAGSWTAPTLDARIELAKPSLGPRHLEQVQVDVTMPDLMKSAGHLASTFTDTGLAGTLRTDFALRSADDMLALSALQLDAARAKIAGSVEIGLASGLARGTLSGTIPDLSPFSGLAGTKLAGRIELKADLATASGQSADVSLTGQNLLFGGPTRGLARLAASGRITDLFGRPSGRADISLSGGTMAQSRLDDAHAKLVSSAPGRFRFDVDIRGNVVAPLMASGTGDAVMNGPAMQVTVSRFNATYGGDKLSLRQPLRVTKDASAFGFTGLALAVGSGSLTGSGALRPEAVALDLHGIDLPVELGARLAGAADVSGRVGLDATVAGTTAAPRGTLVLTGSALRFAAVSQPGLPSLSASARADWQGGRVDVRGRIDAPHNAAIGFAGSVPLELHQPLVFAVPAQGRLAFKLEGDGQLADIAELLPIGEDRLSGRYAIDVNVGGTVAAPDAGGRLGISGGRYESMASGTILSDLALELDGDAERFVLHRLTASDGNSGRLTGQGSILLTASPLPAVDFGATLQRFHVVRLDNASGVASGTVQVTGTLDAPHLAADLKIDNAETSVPDRLPSSVPSLTVVRINSRTGQTMAPPKRTESTVLQTITLDVRINAPGQVFVRGRGLDAEWRGDLTITGTSAAPVIEGTLTVVRGTFSLLGKDFTLSSGTITFAGGSSDPLFNIVATASSTDVTVQVVIGGTASAPTVTLTSQPALPQDEILSRLLFGTSVSQITPVQGLQLAQAAASLTGGGGPDILGSIRKGLGLDRLSIGSGNTVQSALPGPALTPGAPQQQTSGGALGNATLSAGKYIVPGFYVGVVQGASTSESAVRVEGEITPHVSIVGQAGGPGAQGGESIGITLKTDY